MRFDVKNSSGASFEWSVIDWWLLLNVALRYGWRPARTRDTEESNSSYFESGGQTVSAEDAAALASALESFFNDVCRDEIAGEVAERMREVLDDNARDVNPQRFDVLTEPVELLRAIKPEERTIPTWSFDERNIAKLREFAAFCRRGAFKIGG
jgi:hypothetical protein